MAKFNTKIELNGLVLFLAEPEDKSIEEECFNLLFDKSKSFILNNDGGEAGLKNELKEFDISPDKELGHEWIFEINYKSKNVIRKIFQANLRRGHRKWTLEGEDFSLTYAECGDMYDLLDGPSGSKTVYNNYIIKAKEKNLDGFNSIFKSYTSKLK